MQIVEQAESRPGAQLPPGCMGVLDSAAQSAARSAVARQVGAVMKEFRETRALVPNPPVTPSLPSLPSTPTRVQPPAEAAPAATTPTTTGRGSTTRPRDETDEQLRRETRPRSPRPEPMQQPDWIKKVASEMDEAALADAAFEATPVGTGHPSVVTEVHLSAAMKMMKMAVMDREADARRCADLVWMPPVQCKDTGRTFNPGKFYPPPAPTAPTTAVPPAPTASSGTSAPAAQAEPAVPAEPAPVPAANATLRAAREERERRAPQGGVAPRRGGHGTAPSGAGGIVTLADLPPSAAEEDRCAICDGKGVPGVNELVPCGFGDGCCIQEEGEAPHRACWHEACAPELHGWHGRPVVCARHEKNARFKLDVGASRQA